MNDKVILGYGFHFYFTILDRIQINQNKRKLLFLTEHFNLSKVGTAEKCI